MPFISSQGKNFTYPVASKFTGAICRCASEFWSLF